MWLVWTGTACRYYDAVTAVARRRSIFPPSARLVFAHRGGAKLAPENTLAAFERGLDCGADGIECDVHLSRDGVPVVIHDATLDRTTNATGPVGACTAAELAEVDAGFRFRRDGEFPFRGQGIGVPPLDTLLTTVPDADDHRTERTVTGAGARRRRRRSRRTRRRSGLHRLVPSARRSKPCAPKRPEIATSASEPEARWTLYRSWTGLPPVARKPYGAFQVPERAGRLRVVIARVHPAGARRGRHDSGVGD